MKLRIGKAIYGGMGLARIGEEEGPLAGKTVFTPLTLPGELIQAHITEDKRSFFEAEVDAVLEPSPLRTTPACPYFGVCGGCSYQQAVYPHQLEMKADILRESLERAHLAELPVIHTLSGDPWHYRNRIRLHLRSSPFALCYRERRSHALLQVDRCPIAAPLLETAIAVVKKLGDALSLGEYCGEIEFFCTGDDSLLISFFVAKPRSDTAMRLVEICRALKRDLPQLMGGAAFAAHPRQASRLIHSWGEPSLLYDVAGSKYRVSAGSFFQVNRYLVDALASLVCTDRKGRLAWDLYAGVGLFARVLTDKFERVIAVESSPGLGADLRHNLAGTSHRVVKAETLDFLQKNRPSATGPDFAVVDPPRAGLGKAVVSELARIGPAQIVYVSCDPATLSRDLAALVQFGYQLRTITMVDLFPQTFHLESVSVLMRR